MDINMVYFGGGRHVFARIVTCVTLQGQTMCHEFEREHAYSDKNACLIAAAMERGRYNSRMQRREWALQVGMQKQDRKRTNLARFFGLPVFKIHPKTLETHMKSQILCAF